MGAFATSEHWKTTTKIKYKATVKESPKHTSFQ